ncbi:MAG: crotonase/enoyl-CoA hydratase family protein [Burkholderiales bacterium]
MEHIAVSRDGHVLVIRIDRPEKLNALTPAMYHALGAALHQLNEDRELRVAVVHGEGRHFTSGLQLDLWSDAFASGTPFTPSAGEIDPFGLTGEPSAKPIVMAVQGYCFTWGVEMLLNTELRVAASDTRFQMLEVTRGIYPCAGATLRLPREIGWGNAHRVLLTGEPWTADEALRWGLVQAVVEPGAQLAAAMAYAQTIAVNAPLGVQGCLKATRFALDAERAAAVTQMSRDLVPVMRSEDAAEGVRSFLERRKAVFKGR